MKILVVEDDRKLGQFIRNGLEEQAMTVVWVRTAAEARDAMALGGFDAVVLDLGLPDADGLDLLRAWRADGSAPHVLILSAQGSVDDRVRGLNLGADDYLAKPFSFAELLARIRSVSRRTGGRKATVLEVGGIRMDLVTRKVLLAGSEVSMTQREFALLEYFLRNPGRVLTRTQIAESIWECHFDMETNLIDVYVGRLRAKLKAASPPVSAAIHTVRGVGYQLS